MSTPFLGTVEVKEKASQFTTVTLDGDNAKISVGGSPIGTGISTFISSGGPPDVPNLGTEGREGQLELLGLSDTTAISFGADDDGGAIHMNGANSQQRAFLGHGHFYLGGTTAEVGLFPATETQLLDPHKAVIHLRASDATIRAGLAGVADGRILVSGKDGKTTITMEGSSGDIILTNADCAEEFDVVEPEQIRPGAVMVFDEEGRIRKSSQPYDRKVAGIISGAGDYKPGIVLDRRASNETRMPIALMGKVYCNVDAEFSPIEVGDMLTTSATPGHAMKACDPLKAFGAVLGKALGPLASGRGLIPVLVAMQ
jgi:hypothetical protein